MLVNVCPLHTPKTAYEASLAPDKAINYRHTSIVFFAFGISVAIRIQTFQSLGFCRIIRAGRWFIGTVLGTVVGVFAVFTLSISAHRLRWFGVILGQALRVNSTRNNLFKIVLGGFAFRCIDAFRYARKITLAAIKTLKSQGAIVIRGALFDLIFTFGIDASGRINSRWRGRVLTQLFIVLAAICELHALFIAVACPIVVPFATQPCTRIIGWADRAVLGTVVDVFAHLAFVISTLGFGRCVATVLGTVVWVFTHLAFAISTLRFGRPVVTVFGTVVGVFAHLAFAVSTLRFGRFVSAEFFIVVTAIAEVSTLVDALAWCTVYPGTAFSFTTSNKGS